MSEYDLNDAGRVSDWRSEFKRLEGAYAPATLKSYVTDVRLFVEWCEERGASALPADVETICTFLEAEAETLCPSSVRRRLYEVVLVFWTGC